MKKWSVKMKSTFYSEAEYGYHGKDYRKTLISYVVRQKMGMAAAINASTHRGEIYLFELLSMIPHHQSDDPYIADHLQNYVP